MSTTIESLELQIQQDSTSAVKGIDALKGSLDRLKNATSALGLRRVANQISAVNTAASGATASNSANLSGLADALSKLSNCGKITLSSTIAKQIPEITTAANGIQSDTGSKLSDLASGLSALSAVGSVTISPAIARNIQGIVDVSRQINPADMTNIRDMGAAISSLSSIQGLTISSSIANQIGNLVSAAQQIQTAPLAAFGNLATALQPLSTLNGLDIGTLVRQLNRIPQLATAFNGINWSEFTSQIQQLATALEPLVTRLNTLSTLFSRLPANMRRLVTSTNGLRAANNALSTSYVNLWARSRMAYNMIKRGASLIAGWINKSNEYVESLNLFTASLGKYADEAQAYAEKVAEVMGIDPADWMRSQGVFNTIIKGFGVAGDKAYQMSQQLTQLGYDISSFYNIPVSEAMQKLESGIAGELEPLRRLGYDLSKARLMEEAHALGIKKKFSEMTQGEKSQLRYIAIMKQVSTAHGDMARTLETPANMLRILKAQFEQLARALGNLFLPALQAILPPMIALVKVIRMLVESVASAIGFKLPEIDYSGVEDGSSALDDMGDEAEDAQDKIKKLKRTIMGFDELNVLKKQKDDDDDTDDEFDLDLSKYGYDFLGDFNSKIDELVKKIKDALWEIEVIISGFLLALGAILVFTGANVPLGLGLMAIGAVGLAAAIIENWGHMTERLAKVLSLVTAVVAGFLLGVGAVLVFTGANIPLGLGMMAAGAVALAASVAINWTFLRDNIAAILAAITALVGGFLLGLGAVLTFTGANIPLGLALMAAGALALVTAAALNWDFLPENIRHVLAMIMGFVGGFLLAIGLVVAIAGGPTMLPLGIALMVAGLVSIASAVALDWTYLVGNIQEVLRMITVVLCGALLAIGALLTFAVPGHTGLGIALMIAGIAGLVSTLPIDWNHILTTISAVLKEVGIVVGVSFLALGALLAFASPATMPLGIALLALGAGALIAGVALNWGALKTTVTQILADITLVAGSAFIALGTILALSFANVPLGIALIALGAASLVTGAALDWSRLTSNIQTVIDTITMIVSAAMIALGAVLAFSGIGIPLGIALMAAGAVGLAASVAVKWNLVSDQIKKVCVAIEGVVSAAALALGAVMTFSGANLPLGIALMVAGAAGLVATVALNWNAIVTSVSGVLKEIGAVLGVSLAAIGIILIATGVALPLGVALLAAGAASFVTSVALNWNTCKEGVFNVLKAILDGAGKAMLAIGLILVVSGVGLPLGIALIAAGAVSLVGAASPDWSSFVNKIGTFFSTIARLFVGVALVALGLLLCCSGVGLPLGIGLIAAGASAIAKPQSFNVESLINIGKQAIEGLKKGVADAWKGFLDFWKGIFDGAVNWVKGLFGIASPSTLFQSIATDMVLGADVGFTETWPTFEETADTSMNGLIMDMQTTLGASDGSPSTVFSGIGTSMVLGADQGYSTQWAIFASDAENLTNTLVSDEQFLMSDMVGQDITTNLVSGMQNGYATQWSPFSKDAKNSATTLMNSQRTIMSNQEGQTITGNLVGGMQSSFSSKWMSFSTAADQDARRLMDNERNILSNSEGNTIGNNLVSGIYNGAGSAWSGLLSFVQNLARNLINSVKSIFGIASPSKVFAGIGENLDAGLENGLNSGKGSLLDTVGSISKAVGDNFNPDMTVTPHVEPLKNAYDFADSTMLAEERLQVESDSENAAVNSIATMLMEMLGIMRQGDNGSNRDTKIIIDGREVFNVVVRENNRAINRTGASPIRV